MCLDTENHVKWHNDYVKCSYEYLWICNIRVTRFDSLLMCFGLVILIKEAIITCVFASYHLANACHHLGTWHHLLTSLHHSLDDSSLPFYLLLNSNTIFLSWHAYFFLPPNLFLWQFPSLFNWSFHDSPNMTLQ